MDNIKNSSCFEIKIYIDKNGDVTITSLFKELVPLIKELSPNNIIEINI